MTSYLVPLFLSFSAKWMLVLICVLAHEVGHILVAGFYRVPVKKIGLNWTGIYIQRSRSVGWPEIATCLGGAAMNFAFAIAFWNSNHWFALCNLIFALVNLLPISHSDGTHALEAISATQQQSSS